MTTARTSASAARSGGADVGKDALQVPAHGQAGVFGGGGRSADDRQAALSREALDRPRVDCLDGYDRAGLEFLRRLDDSIEQALEVFFGFRDTVEFGRVEVVAAGHALGEARPVRVQAAGNRDDAAGVGILSQKQPDRERHVGTLCRTEPDRGLTDEIDELGGLGLVARQVSAERHPEGDRCGDGLA